MALEAPPARFIWAGRDELIAFLTGVIRALPDLPSDAYLTSWFRDRTSNTRVGGHPQSLHLVGLALDVLPATEAVRAAFARQGLIAVNEGDHVHVQLRPASQVSQALYRLVA